MAFANTYHRRSVAATAAKPCYVCYKPTSTVLNQEDGKDWFYICPGHLADRGFASPLVDPAEEAARLRKEELEREIELVKREYEDKAAKKKAKGKDKDKEVQKKKDEIAKREEADKDDKVKALEEEKQAQSPSLEVGPRVFALHKSVHQMRLTRLRNAQQAKQTQERLRNPPAFPSVPNGGL